MLKVTQLEIVRKDLQMDKKQGEEDPEGAIDLRVAGVVQVHCISWVPEVLGSWERPLVGNSACSRNPYKSNILSSSLHLAP